MNHRLFRPALGTLLALGTGLNAHAEVTPQQLATFRIAERQLTASVLPQGSVSVGDLRYELETSRFVALDSSATKSVELGSSGAGVNATGLMILHTFQPGPGIEEWRAACGLAHRKLQPPPEGPTVLRYEIEYADGTKIEIPVRFGEGIEQWYRVQTVAPMLWAKNHWTRDIQSNSTEKVVLYSMEIPNPRPNQPIKTLRALPSTEPHKNYGTALIFGFGLDDQPLPGKLYVVDNKPIGNDRQEEGSFDKPFGSLQRALDVMQPGDTVLVRGGIYALETPVVKKFSGQKEKWLTVSAFPGETPVLDAAGAAIDYREKPYGTQNNALGEFQQDTGALHFWGDPDYARIQGICVENSLRAGISVSGQAETNKTGQGSSWGQTDHVEILFNRTVRCFSMGIISHQVNDLRVIGNCVIRPHALEMVFNPFTGQQISQSELPQEAIDLSRNRRFEVAFNTVTGGTKEAIDCISVEDGSVHHNYIDSCLNGIYIDSWSVPIYRVNIYRNFIRNAYSGIPLATEGGSDLMDIQIHHNIVVDSKSSAIDVTEATYKAQPAKVQRHWVFNNTINGTGQHALSIGWQSAGITVAGFRTNPNFREVGVWDNLVVHAGGMPLKNVYALTADEHAIVFTNNLVWPANEDTTPEWLRANKSWNGTDFEKGQNTLVADPLYNDPTRGDYRLKKGSPAIGRGRDGDDLGALPSDVAWIPGLDFAGTVTSFYHGETAWEPLSIPRPLYTVHRNNLQRPSWFQRGRYGPDFRTLPAGEQSFAGITFFIEEDAHDSRPNVLVPAGISTESKAESIRIPVGRKAAKLAFLHNVHIADRKILGEQGQIFHYRVRYANGDPVDIPVRVGQEIEEWQSPKILPVKNARIAWTQMVVAKKLTDANPVLHLYAFQWQNPKPQMEIESIEIIRDAPPLAATPAIFAISIGNE